MFLFLRQSGMTALIMWVPTAVATSAHAGPDHASGAESGSLWWGALILVAAVVAACLASWLTPREDPLPARFRRPHQPLLGPPLSHDMPDHRQAGDGER
jgi:hypothetical protein